MKLKMQDLEDEKLELQQMLKENDQKLELQASKYEKEIAIISQKTEFLKV